MKKILAAAVAIALSVTSAFAYSHNVGVGFTVPISSVGTSQVGESDIFQIGYGVHGFYAGILDCGFTFKVTESVGLSTSKDVKVQNTNANYGIFANTSVGAGWSFINTDKMTLSALGMLGFILSAYPKNESLFYQGFLHDYTYTLGVVMFDVGGDLYFSYKLGENIGLFANVEARYLVAGTEFGSISDTWNGKTTTSTIELGDLKGKFHVAPTIGISWKF